MSLGERLRSGRHGPTCYDPGLMSPELALLALCFTVWQTYLSRRAVFPPAAAVGKEKKTF